jgi:hypothetical protein
LNQDEKPDNHNGIGAVYGHGRGPSGRHPGGRLRWIGMSALLDRKIL